MLGLVYISSEKQCTIQPEFRRLNILPVSMVNTVQAEFLRPDILRYVRYSPNSRAQYFTMYTVQAEFQSSTILSIRPVKPELQNMLELRSVQPYFQKPNIFSMYVYVQYAEFKRSTVLYSTAYIYSTVKPQFQRPNILPKCSVTLLPCGGYICLLFCFQGPLQRRKSIPWPVHWYKKPTLYRFNLKHRTIVY